MQLLFTRDSALVFEQEIAEEAEREQKHLCGFSTLSACSCGNGFAFRIRFRFCFWHSSQFLFFLTGGSRGNREEAHVVLRFLCCLCFLLFQCVCFWPSNQVLVFEQEIAEEAEREPKSCCDFSAPSASSCSNAITFHSRLSSRF